MTGQVRPYYGALSMKSFLYKYVHIGYVTISFSDWDHGNWFLIGCISILPPLSLGPLELVLDWLYPWLITILLKEGVIFPQVRKE